MLALAIANDRRVEEEPRPGGQRDQAVDDLLHRLRGDLAAALETHGMADVREEETQIVGDLGDGADGRARVSSHAFLLDGDGGRQALDAVAVGLLHLLEKLSRIGRQGLDVSSLALGIERVESECGLARARDARDDDQPPARDLDVDPLQVVPARPADDDATRHSRRVVAGATARAGHEQPSSSRAAETAASSRVRYAA